MNPSKGEEVVFVRDAERSDANEAFKRATNGERTKGKDWERGNGTLEQVSLSRIASWLLRCQMIGR